MYNLIIKYSMYKKGRRGLRPDSLAWHKACGGVGELPFARTWPGGCGLLARDAGPPNGRGREICRKEYKFERIIRNVFCIKAEFPQGEGRAAGRPGAAGASGRSPLKPSPAGDGLACGPNAPPAQTCGGALPQFSGAFIQSSFEMRAQSGYNGERNQGRMCHDEKTAGPGRCGASAAGCRL